MAKIDLSLFGITGPVNDTEEGARPGALPSLVWPGTAEAYSRGCICPVAENQKRLKDGEQPLLFANCRVHNKVCQAAPCGHGEHIGTHFRCEHCTNVLHVCNACEAVYLEDGIDPSEGGWVLVLNEKQVKEWRCRRCR